MAAFTLSYVYDLSNFINVNIAFAPLPSNLGIAQSLKDGAFGGRVSKAIDALLAHQLLQAIGSSQIRKLVC